MSITPSLLAAIFLTLEGSQVHAALRARATAARTAQVTQLIIKHARAVQVDPVLVAAIVSVENPSLRPAARNASNLGIMQVHTRWLRRTDWQRVCGTDLTDIDTNICFGVRVLRVHLAEHRSLVDGLLGYNGCRSARCRGYATNVIERRDAGRRALSNGRTQTASGGAPRQGPAPQGAEADTPLLIRFDRNRNSRLERAERDSARAHLAAHPELRQPMRGQRLPATGTPGPRMSPKDVQQYAPSVDLYASTALRTLFLTFEHADWEQELSAFWHTDVDVPATMEVDGIVYRDVGVKFRGNNSFHMVPDGLKRSFSISIDAWRKQELLGHTSLNLLNANQDASFLRSILFLDIAREYIPAPKANMVRVVVNGELWGLYVNQQTFSKELLQEQLGNTAGTRWKSPNNSPGGGFNYLGEDIARYRRWYEMRGKDDTTAWRSLVHVTRVLATSPPERLEAELAPVMDVDQVLRFLALDIALVNGDGYWNDGSDFNVLRDARGRFQALPHDVNEAFRTRANATSPDPLVALADTNKALRSRLLAVPALRARYAGYVRDIADTWLDPGRIAPIIERYRALIEADVARDTRKLGTYDAFSAATYTGGDAGPTTLLGFVRLRREYLLTHPEVGGVPRKE